MANISVASFNTRWGRDVRGRPIDVAAVVRRLDADVVVLQESWRPSGGAGLARTVGGLLGYRVFELPLARGSVVTSTRPRPLPSGIRRPAPGYLDPTRRADRLRGFRPGRSATAGLALQPAPPLAAQAPRPRPSPLSDESAFVGDWGLALLTRLRVRRRVQVDLGQLRLDRARRGALLVEVDVGGEPFMVVGTHLAHLTHGSLLQLRGLRRSLPGLDQAAALAGDMNLWGPVVGTFLPGWRRAVLGRTWPAHCPHSQIDHVFVTPDVQVVAGEVLGDVGSDHRPVRATLQVA